MRAFIVFFCVFLATLCGYGQTFSISQMVNPDPNQGDQWSILLAGNRAIACGSSNLYYDGSSWAIISSQAGGRISGIDKGGGEIYAVYSSTALYSWNDSANSWGLASNYPTGSFSFFHPFVLNESNVYLVTGDTENYGWIYHWDGTNFTALSSEYWYTYCAIYVKDQNNIFVATYKNVNYDSRLIKYNNVTMSNSVLYTFPDDRGSPDVIRSKDNNIFFVLTSGGDIYRWNNSLSQMDKIFHYDNTTVGFGGNMIIIDNDNIITSGYGGIRHVKVSTGQHTVLYPTAPTFYIGGASYNGNGSLSQNLKLYL